ncbi:zinc-binding dehydrogenase [Aeromicrobium sp. 636]|uniref:NADP-dependent oxidoreductase n=1 Tax=Aeromicrobium senzhongii TaxID=2663859 RepID=A0A8I0EXA0_9ACTN|nr:MULTISPECIES: NADP-dependent oxidoreductase [Aeromicrobium]MBC9227269.1 NADP-dependent oxidoreductase [Aeromicrobium senzhongii]MCQ3999367.1 zinc-binding dehydrogenase [Aeromicrobium sp. 636]MTB88321.1 zinc-binding dehydrogenase [Aeromicrobium senzhongii]QNL94703.1 NADP-dependent oxidoreductase [Aeromicrobium senzhongii]
MRTSMTTTTREIHLAQRPSGLPGPETYRFVERELRELREGDVLVENIVLTVDPYMRPRMNDVKSYVPPFKLDHALDGGAVGVVVESRSEALPVGTVVSHGLGWREHAVLADKYAKRIELNGLPSSYFLGVLGMPGMTAYAGLFDVAAFQPGDSVFVSAAAGAVGSLVGQFARLGGADRVVGSAGSAEKVALLVDELKFDAAINYRDGDVMGQVGAAFPDGFDVYFDNVGGDHLEAALEHINERGRMALCGSISGYNDPNASGPRNMFKAVGKRLTMRGFIVSDHEHLRPEFEQKVGQWLRDGDLAYRETTWNGLDAMPEAFAGLLTGANTGKAIVRLREDPAS